jgi:hypothetical protein
VEDFRRNFISWPAKLVASHVSIKQLGGATTIVLARNTDIVTPIGKANE